VVKTLSCDPTVDRVRAFDRLVQPSVAGVDMVTVDVTDESFAESLAGVGSLVHLAEDPGHRSDEVVAVATLERVLAAAERASCEHVLVVSSAMVYGAHGDNPVPLTEHHPVRPVRALRYATAKVRVEEVAGDWSARTGVPVAVLRPTTTLSERGVSYVSRAMRSAMSLRPAMVEPPIQFLHHDDLASAIARVSVGRWDSVFNVAPEGGIDPDVFGDLLVEELAWPEPMEGARVRAARMVRRRPVDRALTAYVSHPWVVANDRLRHTGWKPRFSNEEAYVLGTPEPMWRRYASRRRQELALGLGGAAAMGAVAGIGLAARRFLR
jgi:nucleoside-diphosphate-sugar epimerase